MPQLMPMVWVVSGAIIIYVMIMSLYLYYYFNSVEMEWSESLVSETFWSW